MHLAEAQHDALFVGIDAVEAGAEPDGNGNQDQQQDAAPRDAAAGHELEETVLAAPQQFIKIWGIGAGTEAAATRAGRAVAARYRSHGPLPPTPPMQTPTWQPPGQPTPLLRSFL